MYYLNYFIIFSLIGHLLETFVYTNNESGILYGPWTPVYGFGIIIIILIEIYLDKISKNKKVKLFLNFIFCSIILTIIEAIGGYLIEILFHKVFWNYSYLKFHIGKYIALEMALVWGISGVIVNYFIKPFFDKIISKIPKVLTYIFLIFMIIDFICTLIFKR